MLETFKNTDAIARYIMSGGVIRVYPEARRRRYHRWTR